MAGSGLTLAAPLADLSFITWPGRTVALEGTIVSGFPLANKSFNQSYAGTACSYLD